MTNMPPIHPGEHLAEMLEELGISQYRLAKTMGTPARRINEIIHGNRSITADTALRLGQALGMTPEFWLNLQRMYDLDVARSSTDVRAIHPLPCRSITPPYGRGAVPLKRFSACPPSSLSAPSPQPSPTRGEGVRKISSPLMGEDKGEGGFAPSVILDIFNRESSVFILFLRS